MKNTILILLALSALIFAGCSSDVEDTSGEDYLLAGYYMIAGGETELVDDSKATAPVHQTNYNSTSFANWISAGTTKIVNYPERQQKTYITVSETSVDDVYFISSRTEYPNKEDIIDYYLEEYYVKNVDTDGTDGIWNNADPVVDPDGNSDPKYRETMEVHFQDGSVRQEWIADIPAAGDRYKAFPIDGDMSIPDDESDIVTLVDSDEESWWSSKVYYYQNIKSRISYFSYENKETFGVRYYTQIPETYADLDSKYESSTLILEQTLSRTSTIWDSSYWADLLNYIFGVDSSDGVELAETVIRERIGTNGKKEAVVHSEINTKYDMTLTIDKSISYDLLD
ncbi:MAG: hypothetical protein PQJ50_07255 [Spirochaetales bacterium]|nr:hypothetical protein [Spirochaetales bacterium]